jgi:heme/copper-type cytochrome/quinol oxidase subunit 2
MKFEVHCSELCGLWHAAMRSEAEVVSAGAFHEWIHEEQRKLAPATAVLPKYSTTYVPEPTRRAEPE